VHVLLTHVPLAEQLLVPHAFTPHKTEQSGPAQPASHAHVPFPPLPTAYTHDPWPEQLDGHASAGAVTATAASSE
jgi:hypothetical protein